MSSMLFRLLLVVLAFAYPGNNLIAAEWWGAPDAKKMRLVEVDELKEMVDDIEDIVWGPDDVLFPGAAHAIFGESALLDELGFDANWGEELPFNSKSVLENASVPCATAAVMAADSADACPPKVDTLCRRQGVKRFFVSPKYHDGYDYRLYYMDQDLSLVYVYLKRQVRGGKLCSLKYGIEQRVPLLEKLGEREQCVQTIYLNYSRVFSWTLYILAKRRSVTFQVFRDSVLCSSDILYIGKGGELFYEDNAQKNTTLMCNVDHFCYNTCSRNLGVCMSGEPPVFIPIQWELEEDKVVLYNPISDSEKLAVFSGKEKGDSSVTAHTVASFLHFILPKVPGYELYPYIFNDVTRVVYRNADKDLEWVIAHSVQHDSGTLMKGKILRSKFRKIRGRQHENRICCYRFPYFSDQTDQFGSIRFQTADASFKLDCLQKDGGCGFSILGIDYKMHATILNSVWSICARYTEDGLDLVALADNGFMRIHSESDNPFTIAFDVVKDFNTNSTKRIAVYPAPAGLKSPFPNHISVIRGSISERENVEAECSVVHKYWRYGYEDTFSFERPGTLKWNRQLLHANARGRQMTGVLSEDLLFKRSDKMRFVFSVDKVFWGEKQTVERAFQIFYQKQSVMLFRETGKQENILCETVDEPCFLSFMINSDLFCFGQYGGIISINNMPSFRIEFSYKHLDVGDSSSGQIAYALWKFIAQEGRVTETRIFLDSFNLSDVFSQQKGVAE